MKAPAAAAPSRQLHQDTMALRDYVTAADTTRYDLLPHGVVMVGVTHSNLTMAMPDIRLDLHTTIEGVKEKLYTHTGTKPGHQRLILKNSQGDSLARLDDDRRMLGFYGVESGMVIHIMDEDPYSLSKNGGLEDVSRVQKYRMSEEDYDTRKGTLREWIREQKSKNPEWQVPWNKSESQDGAKEEAAAVGPPPGPESVKDMSVGQRCECMPGGRRGTVMFLGEVEGLGEGYWVGVRFDEPVGKNDGTRKGKRYFECLPSYGAFIRPRNVTVGDFPERDLLDDDDEDEDEI